jgi:hypothetical protein
MMTTANTVKVDKLTPSQMVGMRVTINEGAWKGERGVVTSYIESNGFYHVMTDSGLCLAWHHSEIEPEGNAVTS